jgi:hypothetical protein
MADATPVRIRRTVEAAESMHGVVLDISDEWVLFANLRECAYLDGFDAVRLDKIISAKPQLTFAKFISENNPWPPAAPAGLELSSVHSIITGAMDHGIIVAILREALYPGQLLIGAVTQWRKKSLRLLTIDQKCRWEDFTDKLKFKDITRISFDDDYTRAVLAIAGPIPQRGGQAADSTAPGNETHAAPSQDKTPPAGRFA